MKIKEGFILRSLCKEKIVTPVGINSIDMNQLIALNSTAAFLWEKFYGKDFTVEELAKALTEEYEVDDARALEDSEKLVESWKDAGLLDE